MNERSCLLQAKTLTPAPCPLPQVANCHSTIDYYRLLLVCMTGLER